MEAGARGVLHLVNPGAVTWCGLAREAARLRGLDPDRVRPAATAEVGRPAPRPSYSVLDPGRARERYGVALRPWPEALAEHVAGSARD